MKLLEGKTAIVTGASRGIGKAIALKFAQEGCNIAFTDLFEDENMKATEAELQALGVKAKGYASDASKFDETDRVVGEIVKDFGQIDVLVNNAGIFGLSMQHELTSKNWDDVFDLNMKGLFLCTREVLKVMIKQDKGGGIINIASINGMHPGFGMTAHYDATKGGVIAYTRSLAAEVAIFGIRVNAVAPGLVDSLNLRKFAPDLAATVEKRTPLKKLALPEDVANAVLFLASNAATHITGEIITVDGGYLLT